MSGQGAERRSVERFVSTWTVRLDAKGRISVPAAFRTLLVRDGLDHLYCLPSLDLPALDAGGLRLIAGIDSLVERFPPFSEAREELATVLYGAAETLRFDPEGRVVLTESLKAHAGITDQVVLVGLGPNFRIWEPVRFGDYRAEANAKVRALKRNLGDPGAARQVRGEQE